MIKLTLLLLAICPPLFSQEVSQPTQGDKKEINVVEHEPEFVGGTKELAKFLNTNMKYPKEARKNGVEGIVVVKFEVEADGKIFNPEIVTGEPSLVEEALRLVRKMPKWMPGRQQGVPVRSAYALPIVFKLEK